MQFAYQSAEYLISEKVLSMVVVINYANNLKRLIRTSHHSFSFGNLYYLVV